MATEHLYLVTYDVSDPRRLRRVFRTLRGYGDWVQFSVFQCRLGPLRHRRLITELSSLIHQKEDQVLIFPLGPVKSTPVRVASIGRAFEPISREPVII
jgi:CRISPR-associated protein Cas2